MSEPWSMDPHKIASKVGMPLDELAARVASCEQELCPNAGCDFGAQVTPREVAFPDRVAVVAKVAMGCTRNCADARIRSMHANANTRMIAQGILSFEECYREGNNS